MKSTASGRGPNVAQRVPSKERDPLNTGNNTLKTKISKMGKNPVILRGAKFYPVEV